MSSSQHPAGRDALGSRIQQLLAEDAPIHAPYTLRERVLRTTEVTRQLKPWPRWLRPWGIRPAQVRHLAVLAGTFGLLIATAVGIALLGDHLLLVTGGQTQSPAPSSTAPAWHRVTATPERGYALQDVVAGGPGFVAVGSGGLFGPGMSWVSADGTSWTEGPAAAALETTILDTVAVTNGGLVAFGRSCGTNSCAFDAISGAHAPLTGAWTVDPAVLSGSPPEGWQGKPTQIALGGPRLLAVGYLACSCSGATGRVWTSVDGIDWTSVPYGPVFDQAEFLSVIWAKGTFVAVGASDTVTGDTATGQTVDHLDASVWTSTDGLTWTREFADSASANSSMLSVTAGGPGFVAVGTSGSSAAVWTSADAVHWTRVPDGPAFAGAQMHGVAAGPSGLVAVGYGGGSALIWRSPDGLNWGLVSSGTDFAGAQALSVAALGDTFVVVGQADPAEDAQAYVWVGR